MLLTRLFLVNNSIIDQIRFVWCIEDWPRKSIRGRQISNVVEEFHEVINIVNLDVLPSHLDHLQIDLYISMRPFRGTRGTKTSLWDWRGVVIYLHIMARHVEPLIFFSKQIRFLFFCCYFQFFCCAVIISTTSDFEVGVRSQSSPPHSTLDAGNQLCKRIARCTFFCTQFGMKSCRYLEPKVGTSFCVTCFFKLAIFAIITEHRTRLLHFRLHISCNF